MGRKRQDVTDAELAVLQVLWDRGSSNIRQLTEVVYPEDIDTQYSTVKRLLARMEAKGYVARDRSQSVHSFEATMSRDQLVGRRLEAVAEALCDGSISPLLTHLAKAKTLTRKQQQTLRQLIIELNDTSKTKKR